MQTNHIYTLPDLEEMLEEVQKLTFAENPTFLEISGHASSENTFSNILKFFLDPKQPHGVGNLCLKSLLQSCERYNMPFINFESLHIEREHTTKTGRIDLLLLTSKWVIAIENKVWHILNNDLEEYSSYIDEKFADADKLKLVLSIRKETQLKGNFINVTYEDWIESLEQLIQEQKLGERNIYYTYLLQFIETIKKLYTPVTMEKQEIAFLINNQEKIKQLERLQGKLGAYISQRAVAINDKLKIRNGIQKAGVVDGYDIVILYPARKEEVYKMECTIAVEGIKFQICIDPGNRTDRALLNKLELFKNKSSDSYPLENGRIVIGNLLPFETTNEQVVYHLNQLIDGLKITPEAHV